MVALARMTQEEEMGPRPRCDAQGDRSQATRAGLPRRRIRAAARVLTRLLLAVAATAALCLGFGASAIAKSKGEHPHRQASTRARGKLALSCTGVTFEYANFPEASENHVREKISLNGRVIHTEEFWFDGSSATNTVSLPLLPAGEDHLSVHAGWHNSNGASGETDLKQGVLECHEPAFTIEKRQSIPESGLAPTTAPITDAQVGQTVDYEIIVANTGNVPLNLSAFSDPNCDPGTITGGPGEKALAPEAVTTYLCHHLLTQGGAYTNVASIVATPAEGGASKSERSNEVVVDATEARYEMAKLQEIQGTNTGYTSSQLTAALGDTVDYEILVKNTGNAALKFTEFTDVYCDPGTITGGSTHPVPAGATVIYKCSHHLTETGFYYNIASITGGAGSWTDTEATNLVAVNVPTTAASTAPSTTPSSTPDGGVLSSKESSKPKTQAKAKRAAKKRVHHTAVSHRTPKFTG